MIKLVVGVAFSQRIATAVKSCVKFNKLLEEEEILGKEKERNESDESNQEVVILAEGTRTAEDLGKGKKKICCKSAITCSVLWEPL